MPIYKRYDKSFFKRWSSNMSYILGFLYADGNIIKTKRGTHFVALQIKDKEILCKIRKALDSNHKISIRRKDKSIVYRLQIGSKELFDDLSLVGLSPNKTKRIRLPEIPDLFFGDFVRGYFDGDGGVWMGFNHIKSKRPSMTIQVNFTSGSIEFLKDILSRLKRSGVTGGSMYTVKSARYGRLLFGAGDALKLYKIMYNSPHKLFLKRKKLVFEKYKKFAAVAQR